MDLHVNFADKREPATKACLLRGAITLGKICVLQEVAQQQGRNGADFENIILGPAMARAHELESKIAQYPRIIVDEKCKGEILELTKTPAAFAQDADGITYLDYMKTVSPRKKDMARYIAWAEREMTTHKDNDRMRVATKYGWLLSYLRFCFKRLEERTATI